MAATTMLRHPALIASVLAVSGCAADRPDAKLAVRSIAGDHSKLLATTDAGRAYGAGKRHLVEGATGLAIDAFRHAVRLDPKSIDALNGLAAAYDRIGRFDLSRRYYEQALGIEPNAQFILANLGYSLMMQGRP